MYTGAMNHPVPAYGMNPYPAPYMPGSMHMYMPQQPTNAHNSMLPGYVSQVPSLPNTGNRTGMQQSMSEGMLNQQHEMRPNQGTLGQSLLTHSISSPKISDSDMLGCHGSPSSQSESSLLPQIKAIPDLERRISRIDITVMNLEDDLRDVERKTDSIIMNNPDFLQDQHYQSLMRKKRTYLKEKVELLSYRKEVEKELEVCSRRESTVKGGTESAAESIRKKLQEAGITDTYPEYDKFLEPQGPPVNAPSVGTTFGNVLLQPISTSYYTQVTSPNQMVQTNPRVTDNPPHLRLDSLGESNDPMLSPETNEATIRQMLVLDQNPHAEKPNQLSNKRVSQPNISLVTFPPTIDSKPKQSENMNLPVPRYDNAADNTWACEHCTYQNPSSAKSCIMCYKTSDRRIIAQAGADNRSEQSSTADADLNEACEHCTFENPVGTKVCGMCNKSQSKYQRQESYEIVTQSAFADMPTEKKPPTPVTAAAASALATVAVTAVSPITSHEVRGESGKVKGSPQDSSKPAKQVGKIIDEEQDRVCVLFVF